MSCNQLLFELKESGQDYEWYPTTREIMESVCKDIKMELGDNGFSILDIGAGNGSALEMVEELVNLSEYSRISKYAIEKSKILIDQLPSEVFVIGTDFHQQTLIDKQVDIIFCNPPYREFDHWMNRIVSEANAKYIYMVVPERWKSNNKIIKIINRRTGKDIEKDPEWGGSLELLGSFNFEDSEFRKARAKVEIVKIRLKSKNSWRDEVLTDPFDIWFESHFNINAGQSIPDYSYHRGKAERLHDMVKGQNLIERLEELYRKDFDKLLSTYKALQDLDHSLFKELGVDLKQVREGLRMKIKGLKDLYWKELFDNMDTITSRLTSKSRDRLIGKLTEHTSVDFSAENAYAVVLWAIKNANEYFDRQLTEVYMQIADRDNIRNYKSNSKLVEDGWRYQRKEFTHYSLDYRLVLNRYSCFSNKGYDTYDYPNGLSNSIHDILNDICTVGKNLGFDVVTDSRNIEWAPGDKNEFLLKDGSLFMTVRAYLKGTVHIKVNQEFMKKLNVEAGRLNGWVKSPKEAASEMNLDESETEVLFMSNHKLIKSNVKLLTGKQRGK